MFVPLAFESVMKCSGNCSKCVGMYPIWVYRVEKGKRLYKSHFLWEQDNTNEPYKVLSCADMKDKYKAFFDDNISKYKTSGWHVFLFPSADLAKAFHSALDCGALVESLYKVFPHLDEFEI